MAAKAAYNARSARMAADKEAIERKRISDASNFVSEDAYPSLGKIKPKAPPALNFKKAIEEAPAAPPTPAPASIKKKPVYIPQHCYDDGPEDYDGPEEDAEYNADLASVRRRGDKGIW